LDQAAAQFTTGGFRSRAERNFFPKQSRTTHTASFSLNTSECTICIVQSNTVANGNLISNSNRRYQTPGQRDFIAIDNPLKNGFDPSGRFGATPASTRNVWMLLTHASLKADIDC